MEHIGTTYARGPDGRKHDIAVLRGMGYTVEMDGKLELTGATHSCAYAFIEREARKRGWTRC